MIARRTILAAGLLPLLAPAAQARAALRGTAMLAALEAQSGGRLGVMVRDCASGRGFGWRQHERFAHCSTFKLSLAGKVLADMAVRRIAPDEVLAYSVLDVLPGSPVTEAAAGHLGLAVGALAEAAVTRSDNLAANLLLARIGGPAGLTAFWRALGDSESRLDNPEPLLNRVAPGAVHDTTTPDAMAGTVARLLVGDALPADARAVLWGWMRAATTGLDRLRGGLPQGWVAGDKTGSEFGPEGDAQANDLAIALPPADHPHFRAPLAVAAYYLPGGRRAELGAADSAVLAAVMRIATDFRAWRG